MNINPGEIKNDPEYELLEELAYDDILMFASQYLRRPNPVTRFYFFVLSVTGLYLLGMLIVILFRSDIAAWPVIKYTLYGFLLSFTLIIPVHEGIHGIMYKILGARKIKFGFSLNQLAFYAVADAFVINRKEFTYLALSPFVSISVISLLGMFLVPGLYYWTFLSLLFFHATMCAGDFALLSYYREHPDYEILTFDETLHKKSYFYGRKIGKGENV